MFRPPLFRPGDVYVRPNGDVAIKLDDVPGRSRILIHPGNTPADTKGCILPGKTKGNDFVGQSNAAMSELMGTINRARQADAATGDVTNILIRVH